MQRALVATRPDCVANVARIMSTAGTLNQLSVPESVSAAIASRMLTDASNAFFHIDVDPLTAACPRYDPVVNPSCGTVSPFTRECVQFAQPPCTTVWFDNGTASRPVATGTGNINVSQLVPVKPFLARLDAAYGGQI